MFGLLTSLLTFAIAHWNNGNKFMSMKLKTSIEMMFSYVEMLFMGYLNGRDLKLQLQIL